MAARSCCPSKTLPPVSITATALSPMMKPRLAIAPSFSRVINAISPVKTNRPGAISRTGRASGSARANPIALTNMRSTRFSAGRNIVFTSVLRIAASPSSGGDYSCCAVQSGSIAFFATGALLKQEEKFAMTIFAQHRLLIVLVAVVATFVGRDLARAQNSDAGDLSIELVDPKVLRVCEDPRNMPFSNEKGEGFENKIAELLASKLD